MTIGIANHFFDPRGLQSAPHQRVIHYGRAIRRQAPVIVILARVGTPIGISTNFDVAGARGEDLADFPQNPDQLRSGLNGAYAKHIEVGVVGQTDQNAAIYCLDVDSWRIVMITAFLSDNFLDFVSHR